MSQNIVSFAKSLSKAGIRHVPTFSDVDKRPIDNVAEFYDKPPMTDEECDKYYATAKFIGIICGKGLASVDLDFQGYFWPIFKDVMEGTFPLIWSKIKYVETSQNDGVHFVVRKTGEDGKNEPNAACMRLSKSKPDETDANGNSFLYYSTNKKPVPKRFPATKEGDEWFAYPSGVEIKEFHSYLVIAPSPGYSVVEGSLLDMPVLSKEEWDIIVSVLRALDQKPEVQFKSKPHSVNSNTKTSGTWKGNGSFEEYNARGDHVALLSGKGWTPLGMRGIWEHWQRPGKNRGCSATWNSDMRVFRNFSSSVSDLDAHASYNLSQLYTIFKHGGNYTKSGKDLYAQGYGTRQENNCQFDFIIEKEKPFSNLPEWPLDLLEGIDREIVIEGSKAANIAPDFAANQLMAIASYLINRKMTSVTWDGVHKESVNIWNITVGDASEHKTTILNIIAGPLLEIGRQVLKESKEKIEKWTKESKELNDELNNAKRSKMPSQCAIDSIKVKIAELGQVPVLHQFFVADVTPEALALVAERNRDMIVSGAESDLIDSMLGKYSDGEQTNTIHNNLWDGGMLIIDRLGKQIMTRGYMTVGIIIQPSVLIKLATRVKDAKDIGILSRYLYSKPASKVGARSMKVYKINPQLFCQWNERINEMIKWKEKQLVLSHEAQTIMEDWATRLEKQIGVGGVYEEIKDWIGKAQFGQICRLAAIFHFLSGENENENVITGPTMRKAVRLLEYYLHHAIVCYDDMGKTKEQKASEIVISWLRRSGPKTVRDICRYAPRSVRDLKTTGIKLLLDELVNLGILSENQDSQYVLMDLSPVVAAFSPKSGDSTYDFSLPKDSGDTPLYNNNKDIDLYTTTPITIDPPSHVQVATDTPLVAMSPSSCPPRLQPTPDSQNYRDDEKAATNPKTGNLSSIQNNNLTLSQLLGDKLSTAATAATAAISHCEPKSVVTDRLSMTSIDKRSSDLLTRLMTSSDNHDSDLSMDVIDKIDKIAVIDTSNKRNPSKNVGEDVATTFLEDSILEDCECLNCTTKPIYEYDDEDIFWSRPRVRVNIINNNSGHLEDSL